MPGRFTSELARVHRYRDQLDRLYDKQRVKPSLRELEQDGVPLSRFLWDERRVASELARLVAAGDYCCAPVRVTRLIADKPRDIFTFQPTDRIVHGVVATLLCERLEPLLSPAVYSYRSGRSAQQAVRAFADHVRAHRRRHPDPRARGLLILRADVADYGESIPIDDGAPLWRLLGEVVPAEDDNAWALIRQLVRPVVDGGDDDPRTPLVGLPTGSPLATALNNLYLTPVDRLLDQIDGAFYARFGDDLLFAHPDPAVFAGALERLDAALAELALVFNPSKRRVRFFNGAGRPGHGLDGTTVVDYLGCRISFAPSIGLPARKQTELVRDVRRRLARTAALLAGEAAEQRAAILCQVVNRALEPTDPLAHRHAGSLAYAVDDRRQLRDLDYRLAREVVAAVTGRRGPRGFRLLSYRALRRDYRLGSLVMRANRRGYREVAGGA